MKEKETLIAKYFDNRLDKSEAELLNRWLESPDNQKIFKEYAALHFSLEKIKGIDFEDKKALWKEIEKRATPIPSRKLYWRYAAAASVLVMISLSVIFFNKNDGKAFIEDSGTVDIDLTNVEIGTDKATLTLEDGSQVILDSENDYETDNMKSNGKEIIYNAMVASKKEVAYNYLTIPRGGQFYVQLSDGTKVWLNSESKIKYPKTFVEGEDRLVELVYGEAFFDVSPSTEHGGSKFKVVSPRQNIEVLGTQFNVKAYQNEDSTYTTLLEGKVAVANGFKSSELSPGQQSTIGSGEAITINMVNTYNVSSWKNGVFSFSGTSLEEITKVLSRWYDVEFVFKNPKLKEMRFIGVFRKSQHLKQILTIIEGTNTISNYEMTNQKIILK